MRAPWIRCLLGALLGLPLGGCALITSPAFASRGVPFGATRFDLALMVEGHESALSLPGALLGFVDLPLSLTLDTVLTPLAGLRHLALARRLARPYGERAFEHAELARHPAVVAACGRDVEVEVLGRHHEPERFVLRVRGERGARMVWVTQVAEDSPAENPRGLTERLYAQVGYTAVLWSEDGAPLDLLR